MKKLTGNQLLGLFGLGVLCSAISNTTDEIENKIARGIQAAKDQEKRANELAKIRAEEKRKAGLVKVGNVVSERFAANSTVYRKN